MKTQKIGIIFLISLIMCFVAIADPQYTEAGNSNGYYSGNVTLASTTQGFLTTNYDLSTRAMVSSVGVPLVGDMNGDGTNEIAVFDNAQIKLYTTNDLTPSLVYNIPTNERYSNAVMADMLGDGGKEIVFIREVSNDIIIVRYNGTSLYNYTSVPFGNLILSGGGQTDIISHGTGEKMIKCFGSNCVAVAVLNISVIGIDHFNGMAIFSFNATGTKNNITLDVSTNGDGEIQSYCLPQIRDIQYSDYDGDGNNDVIFSVAKTKSNGGTNFLLYYIQNVDNALTFKRVINNSVANGVLFGSYTSCTATNAVTGSTIANYFTSPLVFAFQDIDVNNGMETLIGIATDDNEFRIRAYKPTGATESTAYLNRYPSSQVADGIMLSNPLKINAFPTYKGLADLQTDVCILGYLSVDNLINLLCGSEMFSYDVDFLSFNNIEYFYQNLSFNVSQTYGRYDTIIHSIKSKTDTTENNNLDEVLTPYGIFELQLENGLVGGSCSLNSQCALNRIWSQPKGTGAIIPADAEKVGYDDLILLKTTNLWYFDDKYSNSAPTFTDYTISPCVNSVWELNTTATITITANDADPSDRVNARAILYYGTSQILDSGYSANFTSGTTITMNFIANTTISSGVIRLMIRDTYDPSGHESYIDLSFSVGNNGVTEGECMTSYVASEAVNESNVSLVADDNNVIKRTLTEADDTMGWGLGATALYIIIMFVIALTVFAKSREWYPHSDLTTIGSILILVEVLLFVIGLLTGIIGVGTAIIIIIFGLLALVLYVKNKMSPSGVG